MCFHPSDSLPLRYVAQNADMIVEERLNLLHPPLSRRESRFAISICPFPFPCLHSCKHLECEMRNMDGYLRTSSKAMESARTPSNPCIVKTMINVLQVFKKSEINFDSDAPRWR